MTQVPPSVSVVMPALNEAHHLETTFDSLDGLVYPRDRIEVIVVDNGSSDDTVAIAERRGARVLRAPGARLGELRNLGARAARGEVLAFVDSDCEADPGWLRAALLRLEDPAIGATGGHTRVPPDAGWLERTLDFHATVEGVRDVEFLPTANLVLRRAVFERLGGFDSKLRSGEDAEFSERLRDSGLRLVSDPDVRAVHRGYPKSLRQLFRKEIWHSAELFRLMRSGRFRAEYLFAVTVPVIYAVCLLAALGACGAAAARGEPGWALAGVALVLLLPAMLSARKAWSRRGAGRLVHSTLYYAVVLVARIWVVAAALAARIRGRTGARELRCG